jgi:hypothetical protein
MKKKVQEIENLSIKSLLIELIKCLEKESINIHDKKILQELNLPVDLVELDTESGGSRVNTFHKNLVQWQDIFDKELPIGEKLTLKHIKNMLLSFISSAEPPIKLHGDSDSSNTSLPLKQSELSIYLEDGIFKEQLSSLAENSVSAFELLSNIIGNNDFQQGLDKIYFYGFDLSETQSLFEQAE